MIRAEKNPSAAKQVLEPVSDVHRNPQKGPRRGVFLNAAMRRPEILIVADQKW